MSRLICVKLTAMREEELLAISEAARMLGVTVETVRRWEREGRIKAVRTPAGHRRFRRSDVEALLKDDK